MQLCAYSPCSNLAEVEHTIDAPFSMSGTHSLSQQIVKICKPCKLIQRMLDKAPGQLNIGTHS